MDTVRHLLANLYTKLIFLFHFLTETIMKLLQSNWKHYQIKNQNQDFHKNMNITNNWEVMKEFLLFLCMKNSMKKML